MDFDQNYHRDESQSDTEEQSEEPFKSDSEHTEGVASENSAPEEIPDNTESTPSPTEVTTGSANNPVDTPEPGAGGTQQNQPGMEARKGGDTEPMTGSTNVQDETSAPPTSQESDDIPSGEDEEEEIPPVRQIRDLLTDFEIRVPVWGITVFTVDGYILAHRLFYDDMPQNIEMAVSSMSAGLITISEDFIRLVDSSADFSQILVDAEHETGDVSFSILLKHIEENVMLTCIFPSDTKLGLVSFEISTVSNKIQEIVEMWDVKLHRETMT